MAGKTEIWQCPQCGDSLDISALGFYAQVECPLCQYSEHVHKLLANFRVEGILGVGGMSVVLRARDLVLNRNVAIKVLNDTYRDSADRISRFENECAMMAKVRHENVVSVYSAGRARKQFYIAMELVDGCDLETLVSRNGALSPQLAVDYTIQVVKGLEAAHKSGLLHRDMKPGNVIITPEGRAKVLDFGLALGKQDEDTEDVIWATPSYVPPETLERKDEDARTDIYALGMTLRYLLTGKEAFNEPIHSVKELLQRKFRLPSMAGVLPGADESLCDLVDHMTAYAPEKRPRSYGDLLAELSAVQEGLIAQTESRSPENRRRALKSKLLYMGITGGLCICALAAGIGIGTPEPRRELLHPAEEYQWELRKKLRMAETELAAGNYDAAYSSYYDLASSPGAEPAIGAWTAAHAAVLAELTGRPQMVSSNIELLRTYVEAAPSYSPAGAALLAQMSQVLAASEGKNVKEVGDSQVRVLTLLFSLRSQLKKGNPDVADTLAAAVEASATAPTPYQVLGKEFKRLAQLWTPDGPDFIYRRAGMAMEHHDVAEARRLLSEVAGHAGADAALKQRAQVMAEVCEVCEAAFNLLKRRCGNKYIPGAQPDKIAQLVKSEFGQAQLANEFQCLCLMLQGKHTEAMKYMGSSNQNSPFCIMVKDWQERLR